MKITIDTDDLEIDAKAEVLRQLVFKKEYDEFYGKKYQKLGCYRTFDVNPEFVEINPKDEKYAFLYKHLDWDYYDEELGHCVSGIEYWESKVQGYESPDIIAMWYWDGDGTLLLHIKGENTAYINSDCKKTYDWDEIDLSA